MKFIEYMKMFNYQDALEFKNDVYYSFIEPICCELQYKLEYYSLNEDKFGKNIGDNLKLMYELCDQLSEKWFESDETIKELPYIDKDTDIENIYKFLGVQEDVIFNYIYGFYDLIINENIKDCSNIIKDRVIAIENYLMLLENDIHSNMIN